MANQRGSRVGIVLISPERITIEKSLRLGFSITNNEAEYNALLTGVAMNNEAEYNAFCTKHISRRNELFIPLLLAALNLDNSSSNDLSYHNGNTFL